MQTDNKGKTFKSTRRAASAGEWMPITLLPLDLSVRWEIVIREPSGGLRNILKPLPVDLWAKLQIAETYSVRAGSLSPDRSLSITVDKPTVEKRPRSLQSSRKTSFHPFRINHS